MFGFVFDLIVTLVVAFVGAIGGVIASDTVVGTAFVVAMRPLAIQQQQQQQQQQQRIPSYSTALQQQPPSAAATAALAAAQNATREVDRLMDRRRVQLCKYFSAVALAALVGALAAGERWPLLWLVRLQCLVVAVCGAAKGPDSIVREDYLRIPLTMVPWVMAFDFFVAA